MLPELEPLFAHAQDLCTKPIFVHFNSDKSQNHEGSARWEILGHYSETYPLFQSGNDSCISKHRISGILFDSISSNITWYKTNAIFPD